MEGKVPFYQVTSESFNTLKQFTSLTKGGDHPETFSALREGLWRVQVGKEVLFAF